MTTKKMDYVQSQAYYESADPYAGTVIDGKEVWTPEQASENLQRTGQDWYMDQYGTVSDGVLNFGFWTSEEQLQDSSYYNGEYYILSDLDGFVPFSAAQREAARTAIGVWDDVTSLTFQETPVAQADIAFGNNDQGPFSGAYAWLPGTFNGLDDYYDNYGFNEIGRLSGDVWVNTGEPSNLDFANSYALSTLIHELGHALGLPHGGDYNADGSPITYADDAYFYQDSKQYTIMSYFTAWETGQANQVDFYDLEILYPQTPMAHDILAIQAMYGVDTTTRTGNTVYGFNSTADRAIFDFSVNDTPLLTIWDAGGKDTLDFSGFTGTSVIDLNQGAFSSGSHVAPSLKYMQDTFYGPTFTQAQYDALLARNNGGDGELSDNVAIAYGAVIENAVGGVNDDILIGNGVSNVLNGGAGDDLLVGGAGKDELIGGAGDDVFAFSDLDLGATDKIRDFDSGDRIDLTAFNIDASDIKIAGNNLFVNTDGVKGYDLQILVQGEKVQAADIIFG